MGIGVFEGKDRVKTSLSNKRANFSAETYGKPIGCVLSEEVDKKFEEMDTVENFINRFVVDNSNDNSKDDFEGSKRGLITRFHDRGWQNEDELTINSFMEELDDFRRELDNRVVDTEWIDGIISSDKELRLDSLSEEGKERFREYDTLIELLKRFVEGGQHQDTIKRWLKFEDCRDEKEITIEFLVGHLFEIKERLIANRKGTGWVDRIIANVRKYLLYG